MPTRSRSLQEAKSPGLGVDAYGGAVIDPTANVIALTEAAVSRLDDLMAAEMRRQDDLRAMTARHDEQTRKLERDYQEKLRDAEAKRIDAIRAVDVNAVAVASGRASDQAAVLASQVQTSADALRSLVATSAATLAQQQAAASAEFAKRLAELERSKYEGAGRSTVADPQLVEMVSEMKALRLSQSTAAGKSEGLSAGWGFLLGGVTLISTLIAIFAALKP